MVSEPLALAECVFFTHGVSRADGPGTGRWTGAVDQLSRSRGSRATEHWAWLRLRKHFPRTPTLQGTDVAWPTREG